MTVIVRSANEADTAAMSQVLVASISELCTADHGNDPSKLSAWLANKSPGGVRAMLANPHGQLFVAELDDAIAAVGAIPATAASRSTTLRLRCGFAASARQC